MSWQRVAALGLLVGGAIAAAAFHNDVIAATLAGAASWSCSTRASDRRRASAITVWPSLEALISFPSSSTNRSTPSVWNFAVTSGCGRRRRRSDARESGLGDEKGRLSPFIRRWRAPASAVTQAAPGKTVPHCLKGKLVEMTTDLVSCLRLTMLQSRSAERLSHGK